MTPDWILVAGTLIFFVTTWATINFGYALFRDLGAKDAEDAEARETAALESVPSDLSAATASVDDPAGSSVDILVEPHAEVVTPAPRN